MLEIRFLAGRTTQSRNAQGPTSRALLPQVRLAQAASMFLQQYDLEWLTYDLMWFCSFLVPDLPAMAGHQRSQMLHDSGNIRR